MSTNQLKGKRASVFSRLSFGLTPPKCAKVVAAHSKCTKLSAAPPKRAKIVSTVSTVPTAPPVPLVHTKVAATTVIVIGYSI